MPCGSRGRGIGTAVLFELTGVTVMKSAIKSARWLIGLVWFGWVLTLAPTTTTALTPAQAGFQTYTNARFGYRIAYPADFSPQGESDNGDGQVFTGGDDAELRVWGGYKRSWGNTCQRPAGRTPPLRGKPAADHIPYGRQGLFRRVGLRIGWHADFLPQKNCPPVASGWL
jgi:hypothetical protein